MAERKRRENEEGRGRCDEPNRKGEKEILSRSNIVGTQVHPGRNLPPALGFRGERQTQYPIPPLNISATETNQTKKNDRKRDRWRD